MVGNVHLYLPVPIIQKGNNNMSDEQKKRGYTQAQNKATQKYIKNNYETLYIRTRKDDEINKAVITDNANKVNESVNEYVVKAVKKRIESGK